jgi:hypothetical protein
MTVDFSGALFLFEAWAFQSCPCVRKDATRAFVFSLALCSRETAFSRFPIGSEFAIFQATIPSLSAFSFSLSFTRLHSLDAASHGYVSVLV